MVIVPVALPHAISDRQIRADSLINPLAIIFVHIPKANPYLSDLESMYVWHPSSTAGPSLPVNTRWQSQAPSFAHRRSQVPLRIEIVHHHHTHTHIHTYLARLAPPKKKDQTSQNKHNSICFHN